MLIELDVFVRQLVNERLVVEKPLELQSNVARSVDVPVEMSLADQG